MSRIVLVMLALVLAAAPLTACGKKGALDPPPSAEENKDD